MNIYTLYRPFIKAFSDKACGGIFSNASYLITPFVHWLPRRRQRRLLRNFTIWGLITRPMTQQCETFL